MLELNSGFGTGTPPYIVLGYNIAVCSFYLILLRRLASTNISIEIRSYVDTFFFINMASLFITCGLIHTAILSRIIFVLPDWWDLGIKVLLFINSIVFGFAIISLIKVEGWCRLRQRLIDMEASK